MAKIWGEILQTNFETILMLWPTVSRFEKEADNNWRKFMLKSQSRLQMASQRDISESILSSPWSCGLFMLLIVAKHTIKPQNSSSRVPEQRGNKNATNFYLLILFNYRASEILLTCFYILASCKNRVRQKKKLLFPGENKEKKSGRQNGDPTIASQQTP